MDFLIVPTLAFERLFVLVILGLGRRRLLWDRCHDQSDGGVAGPRDYRSLSLGTWFRTFSSVTMMVPMARRSLGGSGAMGILRRPIALRSPWQNGYVERSIGSIRRECLDHVIIWGEAHLRQILKAYTAYYNATRTHLGIDKDAPNRRPIERCGVIVANAVLGGLHHR